MNNPPAFPNENNAGNIWNDKGMSLRDYMAAKAMQAILSNPDYTGEDSRLAAASYHVADAMLKAREE